MIAGKEKKILKNIEKVVVKFEERINTEVRRQKKLNMIEERNFKRGKLLGKFIAKMLYRWDNRKFEDKYLKKLKKNQQK